MKSLVIFLFFSSSLFAQDKINSVSVYKDKKFDSEIQSGNVSFVFPKGTDKVEVLKNALPYEKYFSVEFDEKKRIASIKLSENTSENRQIINRFLISNHIKSIEYFGESHTVEDFYSRFLK